MQQAPNLGRYAFVVVSRAATAAGPSSAAFRGHGTLLTKGLKTGGGPRLATRLAGRRALPQGAKRPSVVTGRT